MAARTSTIKSKHAAPKGGAAKGKGSGVQGARVSKPSSSKTKKPAGKTPSKQVKPNMTVQKSKPKKKVYTAEELGIPKLNMITPVGVAKPKGQKKGKVFVDDNESMMTILSLVHADKEGQIESKMQRARQLEEIREARKVEAEKRAEMKKGKLEEVKDSVRRKRSDRKRHSAPEAGAGALGEGEGEKENKKGGKKRKSVSFA